MNTTVVELLDAIRAHLAGFELPELCSVQVSTLACGPRVSGQLACQDTPDLAAGLLAWADSLTQVSAEVWRVPDGASVHLSVSGRSTGGVGIRVYGGTPFTARGLGGVLEPGARASLPFPALRHVAEFGEVDG